MTRRNHNLRMIPSAIAVVLCGLAGTLPGQTLISNRMTAQLQQNGNRLELVSMRNTALGGSTIPFLNDAISSSGGWSLELRDRTSRAVMQVLSPATAGLTLSTSGVFPFLGGQAILATWSGTFQDYAGNSVSGSFTAGFGLAANSDFLDAAFSYSIPGITGLPFFVAQVRFPVVALTTIANPEQPHQLVVPLLAGLRIRDPIAPGAVIPPLQGYAVATNVPLYAYYNEVTRDLFYFGDSDTQRWWKSHELSNQDSRLTFDTLHIPDDILQRSTFTAPYFVRLGALRGDWVDAAATFRAHLATTSWYPGPVGAAGNPMPGAIKSLVAQCDLQQLLADDDMDSMARDTWNATRVYGPGVFDLWYKGHYPDTFAASYFLGYLPGLPSFAGAIREAQAGNGHVAAPYVQSSAGVDYTLVTPPVTSPTPLMVAIEQSALRSVTGQKVVLPFEPQRPMVNLCNGGTPWSGSNGVGGRFAQNLVDICQHTTARGLYLDFFGTDVCYADNHGHAPGGGNWMWVERMQQLRDAKTRIAQLPSPPPFLGLSCESPHSFLTEEVHLTNLYPLEMELLGLDPGRSAVIPFFRMAHDNVKIAKIVGMLNDGNDAGRAAWFVGNEVLAFGQLPTWVNTTVEYQESFVERQLAPLFRFHRRLATLLRDQNFLRYHNGTLQRQPALTVTPPTGFQGSIQPLAGTVPSFLATHLATGAFRAPGTPVDVAFAAANPWVGLNQGTMSLAFTLDPADHGLPAVYSVVFWDDQNVPTNLGSFSGPFQGSAQVQPGQIVYWQFQ